MKTDLKPKTYLKKNIVNDHSILEFYQDDGLNYQIPLADGDDPKTGLTLGEKIIESDIFPEKVLEIGTGKYAPASFILLNNFENISIDGTEIDEYDYGVLNSIIQQNGLEDRFKNHLGNLFDPLVPGKYDLVYSNIALLPVPPKFNATHHDHGGYDGWLYLNEIIEKASTHLTKDGYLALVVFDFLGIHKRNSTSIPSLKERLHENGFIIVNEKPHYKYIRKNGATYQVLPHIKNVYPEALFYNAKKQLTPFSLTSDDLYVYYPFILAQKIG